jgi:8-oxo-dGTP diphosphatase
MPDDRPVLRVVGGAIRRRDQILITQRRPGDSYELHWEFPGGKVEPGEDDRTALARELHEELDVRVAVGDLVKRVLHPLPRVILDLRVYSCELVSGTPSTVGVHALQWVHLDPKRDGTRGLPFPPADEPILAQLRAEAADVASRE